MRKTGKLLTDIFATWGVGHIPFAPGTWGTLLAMLIWAFLPDQWFGLSWKYPIFLHTHHDYLNYVYMTGITLLLSLFAVFISGKAEVELGHDSPKIIIDEVCGYLVSVLFLPRTWILYIYAFAMFRVFDIAKPKPISKLQYLPRGWGVVADDLGAGLVANLILQLILHIKPAFFYLF
jgi:phosphatidylglycerophosphatase A